ncbi:MAG TPA: hypothetical protein VGO80_06395 [Solirubrobacteraceae bacterium]|jgi:DNA-binding response OmpR family regulator|nr:hypothetical protein [Solirubrobacteraceae bacterium]
MNTTSPTPAGSPPTVLVAAANAATRAFIADGLAPDGYTVHAVDRVADAQLWLHHQQPDIAVIDADLPRAFALTRSFLTPAVPVVLLTVYEDVPADAVLDRPVTRLRKPFEWIELRRQMTLLLLAAAAADVRAALPRLLRLRDGQEIVLLDRIGNHTVLLGYDTCGAGAHWASTEDLASGYEVIERHAPAVA